MADLSKDTLLFAKEFRRMCKSFVKCKDCELRDQNCEFGQDINNDEDDERILQCVQRWHDKHAQKTYAQDFFLKFPNARKKYYGGHAYPTICRQIAYGGECKADIQPCSACWKELMEEGENVEY